MKEIDLRGIIPAIVLPMDQTFQPDLSAFQRYIDWLVAQGPIALAVNVDTGEGPHLSFDERCIVLEAAVKAVDGRCKVVAGVAGPYTQQAVRNAQAAKEAGADALLVFPIPVFQGTPLNPEVPYAYHRTIADAVDLPIILFQLQPALGGVVFDANALIKLLEIEQVVAIKEAAFDAKLFLQTKALLDAAPRRITLLTGNDNFILESFIMGAEGALLGFSTIATNQQVRMMKAALEHDYDTAWEISRRLQPLADMIFRPPVTDYRARTKEALRLLGVLESNVVRPPLLPLSAEECEEVRRALITAGLLEG